MNRAQNRETERAAACGVRRLLILCALLLLTSPLTSAAPKTQDQGTILVVASYNPDTRRMSDFITQFEREMGSYGHPFVIMVEDLGCKGLDEAHTWRQKMKDILARYDDGRLRAVILLGQEAWAAFISQDSFDAGIPFFGCFVSENGLLLPQGPVGPEWTPASVNMLDESRRLGTGGGYINRYDLDKNIELILSLYPGIRHIAVVTDNTYGGVSLQALLRSRAADYPQLDFIFIDGRQSERLANEQVAALPRGSAILLGTWRVGREGQYFMTSSINKLVENNPDIPVFTISGTGLGGAAAGGYLPVYQNGANLISEQIDRFYKGRENAVSFGGLQGEYRFERVKLQDFGIPDYKLPKDSIVQDGTELQFRKYRSYILYAVCALCILSALTMFLYFLYHKNKVLRDALQKREHELIGAKERAEESDRLKSAFLANMSHEIRTPLNAIVGFSSLLTEEISPEERAQYSQIISTNSELMLALISDILDISRMETGRIQFHFEKTDIVALCRNALASTEHNRKPGVEARLESSLESFVITTDPQRLLQVLNNLLVNAGKYTDTGCITVGAEVLEKERLVRFTVTDTGTGIPIEKQARVFERFEKLDEFKQGTGLGLAICKQIVSYFGGSIWIDPSYTGGSRFVFTHKTDL